MESPPSNYAKLQEIKAGLGPNQALVLNFRHHRLALFLIDFPADEKLLISVHADANTSESFSIDSEDQLAAEGSTGRVPFNHAEYPQLVAELLAGKYEVTTYTRETLRDLFSQPESEENANHPGAFIISTYAFKRGEGETHFDVATRFMTRIRTLNLGAEEAPHGVLLIFTQRNIPEVIGIFREFGLSPESIYSTDGQVGLKLARLMRGEMSQP